MLKKSKARYRIMAHLFDWAIVFTFCFIIMLLPIKNLIGVNKGNSSVDIFNLVITTLLFGGVCFIFIVFYFVIVPVLLEGQTLGKKFFKIKIIKSDGSNVDFMTMFVRELCGKILIDFASFGFTLLSSLFCVINRSEDHLTFHDVLASTIVIDID